MKKSCYLPQLGILLLLFLAIVFESKAQEKTLLWNTFGLGLPLTDKLDGRIAYMRSTDISSSDLNNNFNWYQLRLAYKINKDWSTRAGVIWLSLPSSGKTSRRYFVNAFHGMKLDRRFTLKNGIQLETHTNESRFDHRVILMSRLGLRKRLDFLGIAPSLNYSLFYNLGGNDIRYFDGTGEQIARNPASGFHRGRVLLNFNFKLNGPLRLSVYYLNNHEFNLLSNQTHKINVLNPNTGKIQRPFNNYNAVGITLTYQLKGKYHDNLLPINF